MDLPALVKNELHKELYRIEAELRGFDPEA